MRVRHAVERGNDHLIDLCATILAAIIVFVLMSSVGWVFIIPHPVVFLIAAAVCLPAVLPSLRAIIFLPDAGGLPSTDADSYTRTREYRDYDIEVAVEEQSQNEDAGPPRYLERSISATATDGGEVVATSASIASAGRHPVTIFDAPLEADGNGRTVSDHAQVVLEDLYDQLAAYETTGATGDATGVESALDVVLGEADENHGWDHDEE